MPPGGLWSWRARSLSAAKAPAGASSIAVQRSAQRGEPGFTRGGGRMDAVPGIVAPKKQPTTVDRVNKTHDMASEEMNGFGCDEKREKLSNHRQNHPPARRRARNPQRVRRRKIAMVDMSKA